MNEAEYNEFIKRLEAEENQGNADEFWGKLNKLSGDGCDNDDTHDDTVKQTDLDNDDIHRNRLESSALYRNPFITESEMDDIDEMNIRFIRTFT